LVYGRIFKKDKENSSNYLTPIHFGNVLIGEVYLNKGTVSNANFWSTRGVHLSS
jgi:hypothetical protein